MLIELNVNGFQPERNNLFGRHGPIWEDNIKIHFREIGYEDMNRIYRGWNGD
jgi:hypothetical protein